MKSGCLWFRISLQYIYMQLIFASFDEKISPLPYIYILLMNGVMKHS